MGLNIKVQGKPESLRESAGWLGGRSRDVHDAGTGIQRARTDSEAGWGGQAGPAFRDTMDKAGRKVDGLAEDLDGTRRALETHADDLDTVRSRMAQAREIAQQAGLQVTDTEIKDPGPTPPQPQPLPEGKCYTPEVEKAHADAVAGQQTYASKVVSYQQCTDTVLEARQIETRSQNELTKFLSSLVDKKAPLTLTDFGVGLIGAQLEQNSKFRTDRAKYETTLREAGKIADDKSLSLQERTNAEADRIAARQKADLAKLKSAETKLARAVEKLPDKLKGFVTKKATFDISEDAPKLSKALPLLKKIPVVGLGLTAAGVGYDIWRGKNPVKAVASGAGGAAAGTLVGTFLGGPPGAVVGFAVGVGTSYLIDEYGDDIANAAGDAAGWTAERAEEAGNWAEDRFDDVKHYFGF